EGWTSAQTSLALRAGVDRSRRRNNPLLPRPPFGKAAGKGFRASPLLLLKDHQDAFLGVELGRKPRAIILSPQSLQRGSFQFVDAREDQAAHSQVDLLGLLAGVERGGSFLLFASRLGSEGHLVTFEDQFPESLLR